MPLPAFANSFGTLPPEFWLWVAGTILGTAALGFAAGVWYARTAPDRALRHAKSECGKLFEYTLGSVEKAQQACALLESFPNLRLTALQIERLESGRGRLLDAIVRIVDRHRKEPDAAILPARKATSLEELNFAWARVPEDPKTAVPNREAFDHNLRALLAAGAEAAFPSGLLLVSMDKVEHLRVRFGSEGADYFLRKVAGLICRSLRDQDLLCRYGADSFAVLMPFTEAEEGQRLAESLRDTIRSYHFRREENGPEVLVTASFGFTTCQPGDSVDLVINRALAALETSQRCGRNQLHVHNGRQTVRCLAG